MRDFLLQKDYIALPKETRERVRAAFGLKRSGPVEVTQNVVTSDGVTQADCMVVNSAALRAYLGVEDGEFEALWEAALAKLDWAGESPDADREALKENPPFTVSESTPPITEPAIVIAVGNPNTSELTVEQLREQAKTLGIKGWNLMGRGKLNEKIAACTAKEITQ